MSTKILHIDDDETFLEGTKMMFATRDIEVRGVSNENEAIRILKADYFTFGLIIIDLDMPLMDGISVLEEVRKINPKIPVVFASAHFGEPTWESRLKDLEEKIKLG